MKSEKVKKNPGNRKNCLIWQVVIWQKMFQIIVWPASISRIFFFDFVVTRFTSVYVCFSFKSAFFYLHHRTLYFYGVRWECKINQNCSQYPELFIILGMLRNSHIFSLNKIRSVFPNVLKLIQFLIFVSGFWNGAQLLGSRRDDGIRIHDHFMMQYRCSLPAREEWMAERVYPARCEWEIASFWKFLLLYSLLPCWTDEICAVCMKISHRLPWRSWLTWDALWTK